MCKQDVERSILLEYDQYYSYCRRGGHGADVRTINLTFMYSANFSFVNVNVCLYPVLDIDSLKLNRPSLLLFNHKHRCNIGLRYSLKREEHLINVRLSMSVMLHLPTLSQKIRGLRSFFSLVSTMSSSLHKVESIVPCNQQKMKIHGILQF